MSRRRVLIVSPWIPSPRAWGFGTRVYQLARELSKRHELHLLSYVKSADASAEPMVREVFANATLIGREEDGGWRKRLAQAASLASTASHRLSSMRDERLQAAIADLHKSHRFDIVQVESSLLGAFRFPEGVPVVLDEHNVEYELLDRIAGSEGSIFRRGFNRIEARKLRQEETTFWRRAAGCVVTSDREAEIVARDAPGALVGVVPNGVDIEYFSPESTFEENTIVFTGALNYRPNAAAVMFFVRKILPHVVQLRRQTKFVVVGRGAPPAIERLAGPNVQVTGAVDDVRPYLRSAAVVVVPLQMGGGTRLKVLEALATGKAVVSTSLGCEGIAARDDEHVALADDPIEFATRVVALMDDRSFARRLGENGRVLVEKEYSWPSIVDRLDRFHTTVLVRGMSAGHVAQAVSRSGELDSAALPVDLDILPSLRKG